MPLETESIVFVNGIRGQKKNKVKAEKRDGVEELTLCPVFTIILSLG